MKEEKKSVYYDSLFRRSVKYNCNYKESRYYRLWQEVIKLIHPDRRILEIGCGTGQFARMLIDTGRTRYFGFDFSSHAISLCHGINVIQYDAYEPEIYLSPGYDLVIALEVLEHIDDLKVLGLIRKGVEIVFTVPEFDDPAHLRLFKSVEEVTSRYSPYIKDLHVTKIGRYYLGHGVIV